MNTKYGKLTGGRLDYAPSVLFTPLGVITNPTRQSYLAAGYKDVIDDPPTPPDGQSAAVSGYTEDATSITVVYKLVPATNPPRTFSKLKLVAALTKQNLWAAFRDWLETAGYYDLFWAAQDFKENYPAFVSGLAAAKERFGLSDAELEAILAASVADA